MARFIIQMPPHGSPELEEASVEYTLKDMIKSVKMAEERGICGVSFAENPDLREPFLLLAAVALNTKIIKLATSINSIYTRSPLLMAKTIANLDDLSNGRAMLGVARGTLVYLNKEGVHFDRPFRRMKEYVEVLRLALRGERFTFSGEIFNLKKAELGFTPIRRSIPIYIGASGPKTLQLAGEIADGVYPKAFSDVESFRGAIDAVTLGAQQIGRDPSKIDIVRSLMLSVCEDGDRARRITKGKLLFHIVNNPQLSLTAEQDDASRIKQAIESEDRDKAIDLVPDGMVEALTVSGTPEECKSKLRNYIELFKSVGVETFRVQPLGPSPKDAFEWAVHVISAQL